MFLLITAQECSPLDIRHIEFSDCRQINLKIQILSFHFFFKDSQLASVPLMLPRPPVLSPPSQYLLFALIDAVLEVCFPRGPFTRNNKFPHILGTVFSPQNLTLCYSFGCSQNFFLKSKFLKRLSMEEEKKSYFKLNHKASQPLSILNPDNQ